MLKKNWLLLLPTLFIVTGLFQSLHTAFQVWYTDPDTASIALTYEGMMQGGWGFLKNFHFPIDNWFLSLILPMTPVFWIFGDGPSVLVVSGVVWFWLTAFFTALIVARLTNVTRGLWGAAFILWASRPALGVAGYLTFSSAHQSTVVWGLFACYLLISWIEKRSISALCGALFLFAITLFSDPWVAPTFLLPAICASLLFLMPLQWPFAIYFQKSSKNENTEQYQLQRIEFLKPVWPKDYPIWGGIIGGIVAAVLFCKTRFLGLVTLATLNNNDFVRISPSLDLSFKRFIEYLPYLFNIIPLPFTVPYFLDVNPSLNNETGFFRSSSFVFFILVNNFIFFSILCFCIYVCVKYWRSFNQTIKFFIYFGLFSILGIFLSTYLVSTVYCPLSMRYFANLFYVLPIILCVFPWKQISNFSKIPFYLFLSAYFTASFISNFQAWKVTRDWRVCQPERIQKIVSALDGEDLQTAYGIAWTSYPQSIAWSKKTPIKVYPLWYNHEYRGFTSNIWTSPDWYAKETGKWAFILSDIDKGICGPYFSCIEAIQNQFGTPSRIKNKDGIVLIEYDQSRNSEIEEEHRRSEPIYLSQEFSSNKMPFNKLIFKGWRKLAEFKYMRTSDSAAPEITFPLNNIMGNSIKVGLELSSTSAYNNRYIEVFKGDQFLNAFSLIPGWNFYNVEVPITKDEASLTLTLKLKDDPNRREKIKEPVGINFKSLNIRTQKQHNHNSTICSDEQINSEE